MKMQTGTLNSYPVFPNWVFEGNMVLTPEISQQIIDGMDGEIPSEDVHFGTLSKRGAKTKYTHVITPEQFKVVFFPAHIPWGFTPNNSARDTVVYGTSFIIKN